VPRVFHIAETEDAEQDLAVEPGRVPLLLVEDDPADAHAIQRLLAGSVYQPLHARSVRDARRIMQTVRPAAILLDIMLLGDESWRLMLELRAQDASADIPLIVTSSAGEDRKAAHLGADEYLAKPLDGGRLIDVLDRVTGRRTLTQVLLVDDEQVTHYLVRQLLPRARYRLWIATDGKDAFERLVQQRPDVILLDIRMPGMDGLEFFSRLYSNPTLADLPVIVLTSSILPPEDRALLDGASLIMSKSELSSGTLMDAIDSVLQVHARVGST
jgi:CheY-like chemotaxis protein